jgi:hypothetical protein
LSNNQVLTRFRRSSPPWRTTTYDTAALALGNAASAARTHGDDRSDDAYQTLLQALMPPSTSSTRSLFGTPRTR